MKRKTKSNGKNKLLVNVHKVRSLQSAELKTATGGACPTSRPVSIPGGSGH